MPHFNEDFSTKINFSFENNFEGNTLGMSETKKKLENKLDQLLTELLETERKYVEDLQQVNYIGYTL